MSENRSIFQRVFGPGKKGQKEPSPPETIQRMRETEEILTKKLDFLEKKVEAELAIAKENGTQNKTGKT